MATEFQRHQTAILTRAVAEVALKVAVQSAAAQSGSSLLQLGALVASNVSTADTRSWTALPKEFQAVRIDAPKSGTLRLRSDSGQDLGTVSVPVTERGAIVYVKQQTAGGAPSLEVYKL